MDKIIFISSLIGMLGLGAMLAVPPLFRFVKARIPLPAAKPEPAPSIVSETASTAEAPPALLSGSDQRPPKIVAEYLTLLKTACPGASLEALYSMAMAGCSPHEALKIENSRLLKLSQEEVK